MCSQKDIFFMNTRGLPQGKGQANKFIVIDRIGSNTYLSYIANNFCNQIIPVSGLYKQLYGI